MVVLAGPNGAGKSICAAHLLRGTLAVEEFVNADTIPRGLIASGTAGTAPVFTHQVAWNRLRTSR
jgi:predicted ABC-type ATPase